MSIENVILALSNGTAGVVSLVLAVSLIRRRVGRNAWYGVRIARAFESDAHWYAINAFGGWVLAAYGAVLLVVGVVALFPALPYSSGAFWALLLAPLILVVPMVAAIMRYAAGLPDVM